MGLFSFLKKNPEFTENVCVHEEAKRKNMMTALRKSLSEGRITIVAYHFRNNRDSVIEWLEKEKIHFHEESNAYLLDRLTAALPEVYLIHAKDLSRRVRNKAPEMPISAEVHLIEHYPLPERDDEILSLTETVSSPIHFIAWSSLDEPLMKVFGGERITVMMKQLGMEESEIISHPFIAKSIRNAQEKIEKKAIGDSECKNSKEWFRLHLQAGTIP